MLAIQNFQQRLFSHYKDSLSLPSTYNYLYGNPVKPVVPLDTNRNGVLVMGAAPPARLAAIGTEFDVPVENCDRPFSATPYFDGRRLRNVIGEKNLLNNYLNLLGLRRRQCWLTCLVKIFLFEESHLSKYRRLGCDWPEYGTAGCFHKLAHQSLDWLAQELELACPRLVITLGIETATVLQAVPGVPHPDELLSGELHDLWLDNTVYPVIHLPGPTMLQSQTENGVTWRWQQWDEQLAVARQVVERLVG